jgi:M6 family metalloprotease-like protein
VGSSARLLAVFLGAAVLFVPVLAVLPDAPATPGGMIQKRVPQHLMIAEPGTAGPMPLPASGASASGQPPRTMVVGTDDIVVVPIEFSNRNHASGRDLSYFDTMFNNPSGPSVNGFYRENSYGLFGVQGTVTNWVRSSRTMENYGDDSTSGVDDQNGAIYRLVVEAVTLANPFVDFSQFDRDGDGVVDHIVIVHAGGAQESTPTSETLIWSHRWAVVDGNPTVPGDQRLVADGVQIYGYIMISEDSPIGVVAHEFGHDLGLPDLYDTDGSSLGVGEWDVMGTGSWNAIPPNRQGTSPAHFGAWAKAILGWLTPIEVTAPLLDWEIPAVETLGTVFRLTIKQTGNGDEYFLVENRQPIGFDAALPGSGVLIWHVDDSMVDNDNDGRRLVDLEEADEAQRENPEDPTDAWADNPTGFGPETIPNSNGYGNLRTGWKVRNVSPSGATMRADLSKDVDDDLAIVRIRNEVAVPVAASTMIVANVGNQGARNQTGVNVTLRVWYDTMNASSERTVTGARKVIASLPGGAFTNLSWTFTPTNVGRYIVSVRVDLAADEIPENNERLSHVSAHEFLFRDNIESGSAQWLTPNQTGNDLYRWEIVDDADLYGSSHSPTSSWRFGFFQTTIPNPLIPEYHYLESGPISVPAGPLYLIYYGRYDLWGRSETPIFINPSDTDHGYTEVSVNGGPWVAVAHAQGRDLRWNVTSSNLASLIPSVGASLRLRFNVTAKILPQAGGWWIDDVFLTPTNFSRGVGIVPVVTERTIEPGAAATFTFKVVNVGDFDDTLRVSAVLPDGWTAQMVVNASATLPLDRVRVSLSPNGEATLQLQVRSPAGVLRGSVAEIPVATASMADGTQQASFTAIAMIHDPLGLGQIQRYLPLLLVIGFGLLVIVIIVDRAKARKFRGAVR